MTRTAEPIVRRARRSDAEAIAELAMALGRWIMGQDTRTTAGDIRGLAFGPRRWCDILVAVEAGEVVGYGLYRHFFEGFTGRRRMFLSDLAVAPDRRRDGIGHILMAAVARKAQSLCCDAITWECSDRNDVALAFYDKLAAQRMPQVVSLQIGRERIEALAAQT